VGLQGIAHEKIDPSGYVSVKGELWKAEVAQGYPAPEKGQAVEVLSVGGLILKVRPPPTTPDKRRWISIAADSQHPLPGPPHILGVFLSKRDPSLFNSGESISRSLLLPAKFRTHSTTDTRLHRLLLPHFDLLPRVS